MDDIQLAVGVISLISAVIQLVTAVILYKASRK
nr:MAG TPA: hypothetical protein [Caudoviricetes sp.]DAK80661.1 MAG TPA: hypothetical protein [Caudoviricetes sp.]DAR67654.1 MAG TPA: hypothetical protein [Caudoviricetes sp.]